jgi:hypothetical protein
MKKRQSPIKLVQLFMEKFNSEEVKDALSTLVDLHESLEEYPDPSPEQMKLYETINIALEKLAILENSIRQHAISETRKLKGNVLSRLYEDSDEGYGTSVLFKD